MVDLGLFSHLVFRVPAGVIGAAAVAGAVVGALVWHWQVNEWTYAWIVIGVVLVLYAIFGG